jgi:hypothetical protein
MKGQFSTTFPDRATHEVIRRRYLAGETCRQIGASYGVSDAPVRNVLRFLGVPMRPGGYRPGRPAPLHRRDPEEVAAARKAS